MSGAKRIFRASLLAIAVVTALPTQGAIARVGPTIRELVEVADIENIAASPDGRMVAFRVERPSVTANSYRIDWYVANLVTGDAHYVADGGTLIRSDNFTERDAPVWSPDNRYIFRRAMVDGAIGIWRTAVDGSGSQLVVGGDADVESLDSGPDGRSLSYVTGPTREEIRTAERKEYDDGILIDASVDPFEGLYRGGWQKGRLATHRLIGTWSSRAGLLWRSPRTRHQLDLSTLRNIATEPEPPRPIIDMMNLPHPIVRTELTSGGTVEVVGDAFDQHLEFRGKNGENATCNSGGCRGSKIAALAQRPETRQILFTRQDPNYRQTLLLWDIASGRVRRIAGGDVQLSGGRFETVPCAIVISAVACVEAGPTSPPRLVEISFAGGAEKTLFDPNSELRSLPKPQVEQLSYKVDDGRIATGVLLYQPGPKPVRAPLFVTYYDCPGYLRGGTGDPYPLEPLVDAGFVVACLNKPQAAKSPDATFEYRAGLDYVTGLVRLLDSRGWIDPARVGMGGLSMGSESVMWTIMNSKVLAAAAVSSVQMEPSYYWGGSVRGRDTPAVYKLFFHAGSPDQDPARWKIISPALNTERITIPLLMQLPEQEARGVMELYSKLTNSTTPVELYAFPDDTHIKFQPRHRFADYQRNLQWFRYWLQDYVDPDPAFAAQYRRWDLLRQRWKGSAK